MNLSRWLICAVPTPHLHLPPPTALRRCWETDSTQQAWHQVRPPWWGHLHFKQFGCCSYGEWFTVRGTRGQRLTLRESLLLFVFTVMFRVPLLSDIWSFTTKHHTFKRSVLSLQQTNPPASLMDWTWHGKWEVHRLSLCWFWWSGQSKNCRSYDALVTFI